MTGRKFVSIVGTAAVAGIAAYASYEHMVSLALAAGQSPSISKMLPFSVDGLVVVASVALVDGRTRKASAWFAFVLGVAVSIIANVLAAGPTVIDRCVSAWPSVALLVTIEVIARGGKKSADAETAEPILITPIKIDDLGRKDETVPVSPSHVTPPKTRRVPTAAAKVAAVAKRMPDASNAKIAAVLDVSESTVRRHRGATVAPAPASGDASVPVSTDATARVNGHSFATVSS